MKDNKGFTLVELLAVIVLIAVLSVVAVSTYRGINESSKKKTLEAKIQQITSAAEKWARENNITTKTTLSVNTLVVEGYITADSAGTDGLAYIKNPVTEENMICNVVELSYKDGIMKSLFNGNVQNCKLATQSLVDSNINIRVVSASGKDLTGTGSIAKWTNEDVVVIVNSTEYDPKATSISYDFEGSTKTKDKDDLSRYDGTTYVTNPNDYYNVYYIKAELLLNTKIVVTYDIPGEGTKSRAYTIRFDKEEATAILKSNNEWLITNSVVKITVDDGKGSGPAAIHVSSDDHYEHAERKEAKPTVTLDDLNVGRYYIWTEDNAGNISHTYKMILEINNQDKSIPVCAVSFEGHVGNNGWYKEVPVTPHAENTEPAGISGNNIGVNTEQNNPVYTGYAAYNTKTNVTTAQRTTETTRDGVDYYCHIKTLAGTYRQASKNLKLDMTPPTVTLEKTSDTTYTRTKMFNISITDGLSGLPNNTEVHYVWSTSSTTRDGGETTSFSLSNNFRTTASITFIGGSPLTGIYYLWIKYSDIEDVAGNVANGINGSGSGGWAVFGPYMFDNTPPVCGGNNGKTTWTKGNYTINQFCLDNKDTVDQSGCAQPFYSKIYTVLNTVKRDSITIYDNVGLSTECDFDVYLDNTSPVCDGVGGKTNWTRGTYTVSQKCSEDANAQSGCLQNTFTKDYIASDTYVTDTIVIFDKVGNTRTCPTNIYLDNTPPVCGAVYGERTTWTNTAVTVSVDCQDAHSGCTKDNFAKTNSSNIDYDHIIIEDKVGNATVCGGPRGYGYLIDIIPPVCIVRNPWNECTVGGPTVIVDCFDPHPDGYRQSGMKSVGGSAPTNSFEGIDDESHMEERLGPFTASTTVYAYDNAGNRADVPISIYSYTQYRKRTCSAAARCSSAGCETAATCTSSCCGTYSCNPVCNSWACIWSDGTVIYYCASYATCSCLSSSAPTCTGYSYSTCNYSCTSQTCCGCATYYRNYPICGCETWSNYTDFTYASQYCTNSEAPTGCQEDTRQVYSYRANYCHD